MAGLFTLMLLVGLYFLPTIVAANRRVPNIGSIAVINVFLGWTLVGWVIALALAFRSVPQLTVGSSVATRANTAGALGPGQMKRCPDCAELVQREARICRYCHFNFDTRIGADGEVRPDDAPVEVSPPPRTEGMNMAWSMLARGDTKFALDQAFHAIQVADSAAALSDIAAFAAAVLERPSQGRQRQRAAVLAQRVEQEQAKTGATLALLPATQHPAQLD